MRSNLRSHSSGPALCLAGAMVLVAPRLALADDAPAAPPKLHRVWVGFTYGFNLEWHPAGDGVCASSEWTCSQSDASRYPPPGQGPLAGQAGRVGAGLGGLGAEITVSTLDFALTDNLLLGLRFGFYFHKGNVNVVDYNMPVIAEARATWVFGAHPIAGGIHPYVLLGAGVADFSSAMSTTVVDATGSHDVTAWRTAGPGFVTTGFGMRFGWPRFALMVAPVKFAFPFGYGSQLTWMPELAIVTAPF